MSEKIMLALKDNTVQIETSRFGLLNVDEKEILSLPEGMIGFPDCVRYVFIKHKEGSPFFWLQSLDNPDLAFVMMDPLLLVPDYELNIIPEDTALLEMETAANGIQAWAIVNIGRREALEVTANLLAPVVINSRKMLGKQIVQFESPYDIRHPVPIKS